MTILWKFQKQIKQNQTYLKPASKVPNVDFLHILQPFLLLGKIKIFRFFNQRLKPE